MYCMKNTRSISGITDVVLYSLETAGCYLLVYTLQNEESHYCFLVFAIRMLRSILFILLQLFINQIVSDIGKIQCKYEMNFLYSI